MPAVDTSSPLSLLVHEARTVIGECLIGRANDHPAPTVQETMDHIAGGLLASMGLGEVAQDVDVRGVALLSVAAVAGLQKIGISEPSVTGLDSALYALEDLLRRTAVARNER